MVREVAAGEIVRAGDAGRGEILSPTSTAAVMIDAKPAPIATPTAAAPQAGLPLLSWATARTPWKADVPAKKTEALKDMLFSTR